MTTTNNQRWNPLDSIRVNHDGENPPAHFLHSPKSELDRFKIEARDGAYKMTIELYDALAHIRKVENLDWK